jgi:hypothetical protein
MSSLQVLVRSAVFLLALAASGDLLALDADATAPDPNDVASGPRWTASYDVSRSDYRLSLGRGALDLGVRLEPRGGVVRLPESRLDASAPGTPGAPLVADLPALSIGLRSTTLKSDAPASNLVDRTFGSGGESYVRKVGIEWKPAQSRLFLNQGLGIRLDGDDRVMVRMRKGSLGLYLRSNF